MERQPAPDFTNAFLATLAPLLFIALLIVWAMLGLLATLGVTYAADRGISRIGARRNAS
ncbi:hypothetical protein [Palleronia sediminis]|uniref:hypothetical protein n=1 Tax=Palleronia sediminis TaxID=2547833 RepID=UPI001454F49A|nr:hypothetical protein [Palleronia sediminis]